MFNLREDSRNEYLTGGADGGMVRWAKTGLANQRFAIVAMPYP